MLGLAAAAGYVYWYATTPRTLAHSPVDFHITLGTPLRGVAQQLENEGVLQQGWLFRVLAQAGGQAAKVKAGSYQFSGALSPLQVLQIITEGDVSHSLVTLVEGWNWRQVRAALARQTDLQQQLPGMSDAEVAAALGLDAPSPEGWLFPDTYHFPKGSNDLDLLQRARTAMQVRLESVWASRMPGLALKSPQDMLILASIVEKETGKANDRAMISAVFNNRLRIGMRLQTDPSVIYGMGSRFQGNIRKADLEADTPWNTYTRNGLPPTPIAMPGAAALQAAVNPAASRALYFVARGDGSSQFSETLAQHNQAVRQYQRGGRR